MIALVMAEVRWWWWWWWAVVAFNCSSNPMCMKRDLLSMWGQATLELLPLLKALVVLPITPFKAVYY
jgi:hypothetical protein